MLRSVIRAVVPMLSKPNPSAASSSLREACFFAGKKERLNAY